VQGALRGSHRVRSGCIMKARSRGPKVTKRSAFRLSFPKATTSVDPEDGCTVQRQLEEPGELVASQAMATSPRVTRSKDAPNVDCGLDPPPPAINAPIPVNRANSSDASGQVPSEEHVAASPHAKALSSAARMNLPTTRPRSVFGYAYGAAATGKPVPIDLAHDPALSGQTPSPAKPRVIAAQEKDVARTPQAKIAAVQTTPRSDKPHAQMLPASARCLTDLSNTPTTAQSTTNARPITRSMSLDTFNAKRDGRIERDLGEID